MAGAGFLHLHNHSEYSLLDGAFRIKDIVSTAVEMEMGAVALTDHGNLFGAIPFFREAKAAGIKPIIGMETYVARGGLSQKTAVKGRARNEHLVLLAKNETGYRNLLELSSIAYTEGFYYKPRIDLELLAEKSEGLIGLTACLQGSIPRLLRDNRRDEALNVARRMASIFAPGDFYIELQNHGIPEEIELIPQLVDLARELELPIVATNDCHFCRADDHEAHDVLLCLQTGKDLADPARGMRSHPETYFKSPEEMQKLFADYPDALSNTLEIAAKCEFELTDKGTQLPIFPIPEPFKTPGEYLEHLVDGYLPERFAEVTDEARERIRYELDIINKMDFAGYFLIVWDIVHAAKEMNIPVGPGRGSAAGSLVCFALGITNIDPLENGLLFERFLNPERISMPDIDIDFCDEKRQEVIDHVVEKYGKENVCQIITFGRMAARAVVRDVGRVLKIPYGDVDKLAKLIPPVPGTRLKDAMQDVPEIKEKYAKEPQIKKLLDLSLRLEGLARHASTHAAGLVITPTALVEHVPLYRSSKGEVTTQYEMKILESIGLLKIDILGLKTLSHLEKTIALIKEHEGIELDIDELPIDDPATFELLKKGQTVALFQLESSGMRDLLRRIEPTVFGDITAVNALYRPGPLGSGMVTDFIERKHGRKKMRYDHELLEPILEETYGVILYQEQVMKIASEMAGFTLGQADILRRAMGKKKVKEMEKQRKAFISGSVERGIPQKTAKKVFELMAHFAGYGFNKSHSAAYAMVSMQTAYLKTHHTEAFMAAAMTSDMGNTDRLIILLDECRNLSLVVDPPDVNSGGTVFGLAGGAISYGLAAIKNAGEKAIRSIVEERKENGPFNDLFDFCDRIDLKQVNRRVLEALIQSGAMDSLPGNRAQKMVSLDRVIQRAQRNQAAKDKGQSLLMFGEGTSDIETVPLEDVPPWDESERLHREKESLGFYFSGHPLDRYRELLGPILSVDSTTLQEKKDRDSVVLAGMVTDQRVINDRKGNQMAFVTLEDFNGSYEVIVFASSFKTSRERLEKDKLVVIPGKITIRDGSDTKIIADKVYTINEALRYLTRAVHLRVEGEKLGDAELESMRDTISRYSGEKSVVLHVKLNGDGEKMVRPRAMGVSPGLELIEELKNISGVEHVEVS
jgi:DNA polymerase-3 subunit alpha